MKKSILLRCFLAGLAFYITPAFAENEDPIFKLGVKTYKQFCSHCHGPKMVSAGSSSYDLRKWPKNKEQGFYQSVTKGKGDMPAWGDILLPEELKALWHYVVTRGGLEPLAALPTTDPVVGADQPGKTGGDTAYGLVDKKYLTACLARNGGVMSSKRARSGVGLDYEISAALAKSLGLQLAVTWFESEPDEETTATRETAAMLAFGLCDISPGFALYAPAFEHVPKERSAIPRWEDRPDDFNPFTSVELQPLIATAPYVRMEIGLVLQKDLLIGTIERIRDVSYLKFGIEQGTLPGVITQRQGGEKLTKHAVTLNPGPAYLWAMENGDFEATLITIGAFDFHRRQNPVSKLKLHKYRHRLGFNLGIAVLKSKQLLVAKLNAALSKMLASGVDRKSVV